MKIVQLICDHCGKKFERYKKEYDRSQKLGFSTACSRTCGAILRNKKCSKGKLSNFHGKVGKGNDHFSPFRYYINKAKSRQKYGSTNLTVEYLRQLWESQKGICPYTRIPMDLPKNTQDHNIKGSPEKASLDRIDSSKGYIEGNVEFVCLSANLAKNGFSRDQMLNFFKQIKP